MTKPLPADFYLSQAAVKRQFNRNMAMKETQGGCPIM